ncbi:beta-N-acetylhexosaminidase [Flavihumibacter stibioxidans]|uniref:beta-N-acetylhexosaminidase n=1 Tax=Flavihumibacter stibioxidans TaxID=1834163 RepID=A0ABR7M4A2_9BACT|nr:glycoside hydrolase family 20 [Flavihumibacter stibioxidans]
MKSVNLLFTFILLVVLTRQASAGIGIIPRPAHVVEGQGSFILTGEVSIISGNATRPEAAYLAGILGKGFGKKISVKNKGLGIVLKLNQKLNNELGNEGYRFSSRKHGIVIEAAGNSGIFYAIQTLRQLLPAGFEFRAQPGQEINIPVLEISDRPRFQWRAFMLDESRHFKGMEVVKNLLDQMAMVKMNVFHWHLTDDQGWRIEIKKYPELTKVGGFRKNTQTSRRSEERTGVPHGGFYTQDQIKEIVSYAAQRHIKVVPEIEMPGHAMAAIAAYPWLGTLGTTNEVAVTFGIMEDSYNVADPRVYQFLNDVLSEVFTLFPSGIVHIGGDEVKFEAWKNSQMMQEMMKREGLNTPADLQIFFTTRISNFIDKNGFRMMGWNEILGGNVHEWQKQEDVKVEQTLAKSAIIHFWKGSLDLVQKAVSDGYDVVNSVHSMTYLDYNYKSIPLSKAYSFDPVPEGLKEEYIPRILGTGCQMWGEWIPTVDKMNLQVFPRLAAYAEVGWTPKTAKNYEDFVKALASLKERWTLAGIRFYEGIE